MDLACSFNQPSMFHGSDGLSYGTRDPNVMCRNGGLSGRTLGPLKIFTKTCLSKKMKIMVARNQNTVIRGDLNGHLGSSNSKRPLFCNFDNVFKVSRSSLLQCLSNDSLAYTNGNGRNVEYVENNEEGSVIESVPDAESNDFSEGQGDDQVMELPSVDELGELLQKALKELEVARLNSTMFEEKAQRISEAAIALKDEAASAWDNVNSTLDTIQLIVNEESISKEAVQKNEDLHSSSGLHIFTLVLVVYRKLLGEEEAITHAPSYYQF